MRGARQALAAALNAKMDPCGCSTDESWALVDAVEKGSPRCA